jgi:hypothetical protein
MHATCCIRLLYITALPPAAIPANVMHGKKQHKKKNTIIVEED